jgi:hypothetical protein
MSDQYSNEDAEIGNEGAGGGQGGDGEEGDDYDYGEEGDDYDYGEEGDDYDYGEEGDGFGGDQKSTGSGAQDDQLSNHSELNEWQFRDRLKYKISDPSELDKLVDLECTILYDRETLVMGSQTQESSMDVEGCQSCGAFSMLEKASCGHKTCIPC